MASFTTGDNIDWLWGSLKPWQILHSTLAERERCGSVLDVWELVNETLSASTTRGQEGDGGRSHGMHFLGDIIDGDFWRHGGVMETIVKECLNARIKNDEEEEEGELALQLSSAHHHHQLIHKCSTDQLAIASSTHELPCTPRSIAWKSTAAANADDQNYCKVEEEYQEADNQEGVLEYEAAAAAEEEEEEGIHGYTEEELEVEEEEEEEEEEVEEEEDRASSLYTQTIRESNYSLQIRSNYQGNPNYREISRDSGSVLVVNPCRSAAAAGGSDDQAAAAVSGVSAELEEGMAASPDLEENIEVCAVCLEKLTHYYEEGVQALACRHAFHTVCIAPWLQRQPHACCPCCRAPIFPDNLAPPLHLPAPLDHSAVHHRQLVHDRYACAGLHELSVQPAHTRAARNDIMGLLADMEAALEHLGFRS